MKAIAAAFLRHGYVRGPIPERLLQDGWRQYKKGWELRILLPYDAASIALVRRQISEAGYRLARVYEKSSIQVVQPIYGRDAVLEVLRAAGHDTRAM